MFLSFPRLKSLVASFAAASMVVHRFSGILVTQSMGRSSLQVRCAWGSLISFHPAWLRAWRAFGYQVLRLVLARLVLRARSWFPGRVFSAVVIGRSSLCGAATARATGMLWSPIVISSMRVRPRWSDWIPSGDCRPAEAMIVLIS